MSDQDLPEADALIEAIRLDNEWRREHKAPAHPVEQLLTAWISSVEARLQTRTAAEQPGVHGTCARCREPLKVNGRMRSCASCSTSWMVPEKRAPLAQSPWVPDAVSEDVEFGPQEFRDQGKPPEQTLTERIRELEAEVERLKAAAANWRERAKTAEAECERLREVHAKAHEDVIAALDKAWSVTP